MPGQVHHRDTQIQPTIDNLELPIDTKCLFKSLPLLQYLDYCCNNTELGDVLFAFLQ